MQFNWDSTPSLISVPREDMCLTYTSNADYWDSIPGNMRKEADWFDGASKLLGCKTKADDVRHCYEWGKRPEDEASMGEKQN